MVVISHMSHEQLRNKLFYIMDLHSDYCISFECEKNTKESTLVAILKRNGTVLKGFILSSIKDPKEDLSILVDQASAGIEFLHNAFKFESNFKVIEEVKIHEEKRA
ncbi:hypothetical protein [Bacillus sp. mrc49]|uniref:hypothetical protein n=1 Tax=Bacillus sp. mrc49 TaxID=2054913 RepID=UPI000C273EE1|nr:hypothetical protein [Bacillus sp. mrc49]PJN90605.1 hypothetical protein CVN76_09415 [Bacillus sp. mrc49]